MHRGPGRPCRPRLNLPHLRGRASAYPMLALTGGDDIAPHWPLGPACGLGGLVGGTQAASTCSRTSPRLTPNHQGLGRHRPSNQGHRSRRHPRHRRRGHPPRPGRLVALPPAAEGLFAEHRARLCGTSGPLPQLLPDAASGVSRQQVASSCASAPPAAGSRPRRPLCWHSSSSCGSSRPATTRGRGDSAVPAGLGGRVPLQDHGARLHRPQPRPDPPHDRFRLTGPGPVPDRADGLYRAADRLGLHRGDFNCSPPRVPSGAEPRDRTSPYARTKTAYRAASSSNSGSSSTR